MAATFYNISEAEMTAFLTEKGFVQISVPRTREMVFAKRVDSEGKMLSLRVFTGIVAGQSRGVGDDAIRVVLMQRDFQGKIYARGGTKRVNRVKNWKNNLTLRLKEFA